MATGWWPAPLLRGQLAANQRQGNPYPSHAHKILTDYWCYYLILKLELLASILLAIKYKIYFSPFKQNIIGGCRSFLGILILIPGLVVGPW